jgi:hypothetical protein
MAFRLIKNIPFNLLTAVFIYGHILSGVLITFNSWYQLKRFGEVRIMPVKLLKIYKLMGILKGQLDGKADMGAVSQFIKAKLS